MELSMVSELGMNAGQHEGHVAVWVARAPDWVKAFHVNG
jgi:hypothetical protein